eukprot:Opistho-1_new@12402
MYPRHQAAGPVAARQQLHPQALAQRRSPGDGQAQPAAIGRCARHAEEAVKHPLQQVRGDARPRVHHVHHHALIASAPGISGIQPVQAHLHRAPLGRVTQGVVQQVVEHAAQVHGRGQQHHLLGAVKTHLDAPLVGQGHQLAHAVAQHGRDVHRGGRLRRGRCLLPRQAQQLAHQVLRAPHACIQLRKLLLRLARRHPGPQVFHLQGHGGHGGAQLVGSVLHKAALGSKGLAQPRQQRVERGDQRHDLVGHPARRAQGDGPQAAVVAPGHLLRHHPQRARRTPHHPPQREQQRGHEQGQRQQHIQGASPCTLR